MPILFNTIVLTLETPLPMPSALVQIMHSRLLVFSPPTFSEPAVLTMLVVTRPSHTLIVREAAWK